MSDAEITDDIVEPAAPARTPVLSRRNLVGGGVALAASGLTGGLLLRKSHAPRAVGGRRKLTVSWNANAVCLAPVLLAKEYGLYEKNGLDVELISFAGSTDQLLEAISTGKADAGVGMIMRWIKPLEQGFDVKLIAGTHGGCARMVGSRRAGVTDDPKSLKGKIIGLSEVSGTGRNTFSILLKAHGLDPEHDVTWRAFPQPLLGEAVRKGEAHAIADGDPVLYLLQKQSDGDLVQVLTNLSEPWQNRVCCVVGMAGKFLREDREAARALAVSLVTAASICSENPDAAARVYAPFAKASVEDLVAVLKSQTHSRHPVGTDLRGDIALYTQELRDVGVMRASTEPSEFSNRIVDDVFV